MQAAGQRLGKVGIQSGFRDTTQFLDRIGESLEKFLGILVELTGVSKDWMHTGKGDIFTQIKGSNMHHLNAPFIAPPNKGRQKVVSSHTDINSNKALISTKKGERYPDDYYSGDDFHFKWHFEKKLLLDVKTNYKEINDLDSPLNTFQNFEHIIDNLNYSYFNKISLQFHSGDKYFKNGVFNYEKYRDDYFSEVRKLEPIKPALVKIAAAIKEFYKDIKDFDTEKVIEGYFFMPPPDISPSIDETQASKEL